MNEKLRSILHVAWTEPRHFFFWLAMLSVAGFAAAAVTTALAGPALLLGFIALGCILGFVVSLPAFILAWIPPVRRLLTRLLAWRFLALACVVTLVALFYALEDWRGRRAWQAFKQEREAKGERFNLAEFTPPPVPADQNFFETPLWSDLHFAPTRGKVIGREPNQSERVVFDIYGPHDDSAPKPGNWSVGQRVDLAAWQAYYRGSNSVAPMNETAQAAFRKRYGLERGLAPLGSAPPTNYFPIAKEPQTPAADVLLALSKFEGNRQLLMAAAARPYARFWVNYEAGFGMLLPHLARMKACGQYLSFHANAALKAGDPATALEDLKLVFRLMETIRGEPSLISQLVRMAMLQIAVQPVWEGLADRQWTEANLSVMEAGLGKLDFLADYQSAMRGERACGLWAVDYIRKVGAYGLEELGVSQGGGPGPSGWDKNLARAVFRLIPSGWFDQNKLSLCRNHETYVLPSVDPERHIVRPAVAHQSQAAFERLRRRPYDMLSQVLLPAIGRCAEKFARAQTTVDSARLACALERYRQANGQFPETLESLAPKFIETVPHDVINGQPLKYRRTDNGQFVLYSVGWNQTDDGGKVGLTKSGNLDVSKGDWVWTFPAR